MRKCMQIILLFLLLSSCLNALELKGKVIAVSDGDTIKLLTQDKVTHKIRLLDIDAPEKSQPFGNKSKENLSKYIAGKTVTVKYTNMDKYSRILGTIYLNNMDVNLQQIKDGYAWVYKQYSSNQIYYQEEKKAKDLKKGLWIAKEPLAPWEYRKKRKSLN